MTLTAATYEPTADDLKLVDEAIRRVGRTVPLTERDRAMLRSLLPAELARGRRDLFSLIRVARKALDHG